MKKNRKVFAILLTFVMAFTFYGLSSAAFAAADDGNLSIKSVEVLQHPEIQQLYRQSIYQGDAAKGEDPDKWYTTMRGINLNDEREFTFEFTVSDKTVGEDPDAYLDTIKLQYGGHDLSEWSNNPNSRGNANNLRDPNGTPYLIQKDKSIAKNEDGSYTITITMDTGCPWNNTTTSAVNKPYDGYHMQRQLYAFSAGQSADNRWFYQTTPTGKGLGTYAMTAVAGNKKVASVDMDIAQYDNGNSWIQKNEFAQSLVKAINGSEVPKSAFSEKKTGLMAAGYVAVDENGNFVKGTREDNVYVEVSILGYGLTDNDKEENQGYNNYARFNAIWNIVVALDESKVDTYLNETKPLMNEDPQKLIDKYKDADPKDVDMINVFYETNVHADEISGIDHTILFVKDLIDGGKAGKKIDYYTWTEDDMNFRYRDPAEGYEKSTAGHVVKDGYDGRFLDKEARTKQVFDTKEALESFIIVNNITSNPDGQAGMRRTNRYSFDLNRDAVFSTMPETIALMKDIMKWDPLIEDEWHGYVQNMLIEPCTAPHDPAYDYDLLANNMRNLTYAAGMAVTANTGYDNFLVPWDHYDAGDWDDGGTIYSPMFAELLGCYGYTIEFPHANSDSFDAGKVINYAQINEVLHGKTDFYAGNRLNGALKDEEGNLRASHEGDIIDTSMKKNAILAKLETKKRGIENVDSMEADKYFIDKKVVGKDENGRLIKDDVIVGRARPKDADGNTLSFFPDYIVIPKGELQYNFAEGIKAINQMMDWGIKVDVTTEDVEYDGKTIEKGSYVLSMYQANRNVIFEVMSKGYDATGFADMYADIYCNLPDVRGFDSIQIYGKGLFDGKTTPQTEAITKKANIKGSAAEYITFESQSTDAVRAVNYLLSKGADVWMLRKDVEGVGEASDYVIRSGDLAKIRSIKDDPVIGQKGIQLEGKYIEALPDAAVALVEPVIQFSNTRTAQTANSGPLWYLLDEYLGFGSMKDYNGSSTLREGANVILDCNTNPYGQSTFPSAFSDAVKSGQVGLVVIGRANHLAGLGVSGVSSDNTFVDVAINGTYNVDDSLYSNKYAKTGTYYARGYTYSNLPEGSKVLFKSLENGEDAFIGGFQATDKDKSVFGDKITIFSTILDGDDFAKPVSTVVFGQYMDYRSHYQKLLPMLATAIYASAAGIVDDMIDPTFEFAKTDDGFEVTAADDEHGAGIGKVSIYKISGDKEILLAEDSLETLSFTTNMDEDVSLKVVVEDKAGNTVEGTFNYAAESGAVEPNPEKPIDTPDVAEAKADALDALDEVAASINESSMTDEEKAAAIEALNQAAASLDDAASVADVMAVVVEASKAANAAIEASAKAQAADKDLAQAKLDAIAEVQAAAAADPAAAQTAIQAIADIQNAASRDDVIAAKAVGLERVEKAVEAAAAAKEAAAKKAAAAKAVKAAKAKTVKGLKVKSKSKKAIVTWKKTKGATAYQVQFQQKGKKWKNLAKASKKTKVTSKKLKKGKKYSFRVRTITKVNGKNVYGKWTKAKTVKIK